jgi:hypothetical protein
MFGKLIYWLTGEFLLRDRPNGGTVIAMRTLLFGSLIYALAFCVSAITVKGATWGFSSRELRADIHETIAWLGAIYAAIYVALYTRFSAQWSYLASLYNQMMAISVSLDFEIPKAKENFINWQAAFMEDAEDLHLATKPMFAGTLLQMIKDPDISAAYKKHAVGGSERFDRLEKRVGLAVTAEEVRLNGTSSYFGKWKFWSQSQV